MAVQTCGDYEFDTKDVLGQGGMGTVYRGRQISLGRTVAIKVLRGDLTQSPDFIQRFRREGELLARLVDTHVVQVYGAGSYEGQHFYAMEFVEGEDLASKIKKGQIFSVDDILHIAEHVGNALQAAWKYKIVHRDIKPSNILVTTDGIVKVMDFGLAKNPESDLTQSQMVMGTAKYIPPEQAQGEVTDFRADLYSLGVVLYELAAGKAPFAGDTPTSLMYQHVHKAPEPLRRLNPNLPAGLELMIMRCMAKKPEQRYPTPDSFLRDVRAVQVGRPPVDEKTLLLSTAGQTMVMDPQSATPPPGPGDFLETPTGATAATALPPVAGARPAPATPLPGETSRGPGLALAVLFVVLLGAGAAYLLHLRPWEEKVVEEVVDPEAWRDEVKPVLTVADEKFKSGLWLDAKQSYEKALEKIPSEDPTHTDTLRKLKICEYWLARESLGHKKAMALAKEIWGEESPEYQEVLRKEMERSFQEMVKNAAQLEEERDWQRAAVAYARAIKGAPEEQKRELELGGSFCQDLAEALQAESRAREAETARKWEAACKEWEAAGKLYQARLGYPRGHEAYLRDAERRVNDSWKTAVEERNRQRGGVFAETLDKAWGLMLEAKWQEALQTARQADKMRESYKVGSEKQHERLAVMMRQLGYAVGAPRGFIYVPGGKFPMGTDHGNPWEGPRHVAETRPFYISVREVTRAEYGRFLKSVFARSHAKCVKGEPASKNHTPDGWSEGGSPEDPVTGVDWYDAMAYASWAALRLPTEVEWEKAAGYVPPEHRARVFPWGDSYDPNAKDVSFFGVHGMGSGPLEWTRDSFEAYPDAPGSRRHADMERDRRILRGGVVLQEDVRENAKVSFRYWHRPTRRNKTFGFRCVMDIQE